MARNIADFNLQKFLDHFNPPHRGAVGTRRDLLPPRALIWQTYGAEEARARAAARSYFLRAFGCEPVKIHIVREEMPFPLVVYRVELLARESKNAVFWVLADGEPLRFPPKRFRRSEP